MKQRLNYELKWLTNGRPTASAPPEFKPEPRRKREGSHVPKKARNAKGRKR